MNLIQRIIVVGLFSLLTTAKAQQTVSVQPTTTGGGSSGIATNVFVIAGTNVTVQTNTAGAVYTVNSAPNVSIIAGTNATVQTNTTGSVYTVNAIPTAPTTFFSNSVDGTITNLNYDDLGTFFDTAPKLTLDSRFTRVDTQYAPVLKIHATNDTGEIIDGSSRALSIGVDLDEFAFIDFYGNGTFNGSVTAGSFGGSGSGLTSLNAGNLSTGTVPTARLGSGTANSTTYLRGDQTWATISTPTFDGFAITNGESVLWTDSNAVSHVFNIAANTVAVGIMLTNPLAAANGLQGYSPALAFASTGQRSSAPAGPKYNTFRAYQISVQDVSNPFGYLRFDSATNNTTTFGYPIDFSSNGTITNSGDIAFGTSGGSHYGFILGPHATSAILLTSDAPNTLGYGVNGSSFQVQINSVAKFQFNSGYLQPIGDAAIDLGQGAGASSRFRNVVISGAVTNDINGAGSGGSITMPSGGGITSNNNGQKMKIIGSQGTGNSYGGSIDIQAAVNGTSSGSTVNPVTTRYLIAPRNHSAAVNNTTEVFSFTLPTTLKVASVHVFATMYINNGTDIQCIGESFVVSAVNKAGTVTAAISGVTPQASISSSGTYTTTWSTSVTSTTVSVRINPTTSLGSILDNYVLYQVWCNSNDPSFSVSD